MQEYIILTTILKEEQKMQQELKNTTDTLQDYLSYIQDDTQVKKNKNRL